MLNLSKIPWNRRRLKSALCAFVLLAAPLSTLSAQAADKPAAFFRRLDDVEQGYLKQHDYAKALDLANNWITYGQQLAWGYSLRSQTYAAMQQYQNALADADKSLQLDPTAGDVYGARGAIYDKLGNYDKAIESWQQALAHVNHLPGGEGSWEHKNIGLLYSKKRNYAAAIREYNEAIRLDPTSCEEACYLRGSVLEYTGRLKEAFTDFSYVSRQEPELVSSLQHNAILSERMGMKEAAAKYWAQANTPPQAAIKLEHLLIPEKLTSTQVETLRAAAKKVAV